jgi:hypothetical protein
MYARSETAVCERSIYLLTLLTDVDAEFEQFAVDAARTPSGILPAHLADQISDLDRNDRSSGSAVPHLPDPEQPKAGTMPSYDVSGLTIASAGAPVTPEAGQTDPQQAVPRGPFRALCCGPLKHADLVAQSQVLELESGTRRKIEGTNARSVVRKMSIGENYEGNITPVRSDISRFSRGTGDIIARRSIRRRATGS